MSISLCRRTRPFSSGLAEDRGCRFNGRAWLNPQHPLREPPERDRTARSRDRPDRLAARPPPGPLTRSLFPATVPPHLEGWPGPRSVPGTRRSRALRGSGRAGQGRRATTSDTHFPVGQRLSCGQELLIPRTAPPPRPKDPRGTAEPCPWDGLRPQLGCWRPGTSLTSREAEGHQRPCCGAPSARWSSANCSSCPGSLN